MLFVSVFFFKQKTANELRISDWSSDVCSSDLHTGRRARGRRTPPPARTRARPCCLPPFAERRCRSIRCHSPAAACRRTASPSSSAPRPTDRKSVVSGKSVSVRVVLGGRRIIKKKNKQKTANRINKKNTI